MKKVIPVAVFSITLLLVALSYQALRGPAAKPVADTGVRIGTQRWAVKNLNVTTFLNGDTIPHAANLAAWEKAAKEGKPAWCYYGNDVANDALYGKLYNYYAVTDPRGLAPKEWLIPTDKDWQTLIDFLGGTAEAGHRMKAKTGWTENLKADNICGFTATPAGLRNATGQFSKMGAYLHMWCATPLATNPTMGKAYTLYYDANNISTSEFDKGYGLSVRCIVDLGN